MTSAVHPRLFELHHRDMQSTKWRSQRCQQHLRQPHCTVLIKQSDSTCLLKFWVDCPLHQGNSERYSVSINVTKRESTRYSEAPSSFGATHILRHRHETQSTEPLLCPKLRIFSADFPNRLYSVVQRLLALETSCGYGYDQGTDKSVFLEAHQTRMTRCFTNRSPPLPSNLISVKKGVKKKNCVRHCVCISLSFAVDVFADQSNPP